CQNFFQDFSRQKWRFPPTNYYLLAFYCTWFGSPKVDCKYIHWDHLQMPHGDFMVAQGYPQGRYSPLDDIESNFYPSLGAYCSRDPSKLCTATIGVIAVSWYPSNTKCDSDDSTDDPKRSLTPTPSLQCPPKVTYGLYFNTVLV
uniref:Glycoprotein endo-alpha-1,2-mannosidase n=1 Tax=Acanthochromis polyacanthus TaxID=80966 RepID=A0A3Q1HGL2_9TELE